jgi:addiction module HigA family antidote
LQTIVSHLFSMDPGWAGRRCGRRLPLKEIVMKNRMRPIHPGEILREEYLVPLDMSANRLAASLHVPSNRISAIVNGERNITADTALRLAKFFGTAPEFWLNLQQAFELRTAEREIDLKPIRALKVG